MSSGGQDGDSPLARLTPSDALASLCWALHSATDPKLRDWLKDIETKLDRPASEWTRSFKALFAAALITDDTWPPAPPANADALLWLLNAIQKFDRWHRPIVPPQGGERAVRIRPEHELSAAKLDDPDDPRFGGDGNGVIIPAYTAVSLSRSLISDMGHLGDRPLLMDMLVYTAYLPRVIQSRDSEGKIDRDVQLKYRRWDALRTAPELLPAGLSPQPDALVVAIAPMLEGESDAKWKLTAGNKGYGLAPLYDKERLDTVIDLALAQGANILLLPEASVAQAHLKHLKTTIDGAVRRHAKTTNQRPSLHYVFAGITAPPPKKPPPNGSPPRHRNYVVVLDRFGRQCMSQDKMFRWDIRHDQLDRYDMHAKFCLDPACLDALQEDIADASTIVLMDLGDIGRVLNLICADMSYDLPGDWMLHLGVDWLNAPIFDHSIGPVDPPPPDGLTWICQRAFRAAAAGSRVMVSNSMALTCRLNQANKDRGRGRPEINPCCVGLFAHRSDAEDGFVRLELALDTGSPMYKFHPWNGAWAALPKAP